MSKNNNDSNKKDNFDLDPLDELNELEDNFTIIETEKDIFDEFDQIEDDNIPVYDSKNGKIVDKVVKLPKPTKVVKSEDETDLIKSIDKVDVSKKSSKPIKLNKPKVVDKNIKLPNIKPKNNSMPKPKVKPKNLNNNKSKSNSDTKIIDNVKVDADGVPLLNQFDTDKIKQSNLIPKVTIHKFSLSKILLILSGIIVIITGIIYGMNDVVKISDNVMYGEHESMAIALIFMGLIFIVLAFYKEIMKHTSLHEISMDFDNTSSSDDKNIKDKSSKSDK